VIDDHVQRHSQEGSTRIAACRAAFAACQRGTGRRGPSSPYDYGRTDTTRLNGVDLTGRATSVPFTAVITGPSWTATDNITIAMSCADSRLPR
jgi:hypothetical protein